MPEHTPAPTHARSLYGFFMYLFSKTALGIYCVWAFTPDFVLHYFNIYYYPQRYWSTAIPIQFLVALTLFAFLIYPSSNLTLSRNIDSINTIRDPFSHYTSKVDVKNNQNENLNCICPDKSKCTKDSYFHNPVSKENQVPQLYDLDIRFVCKKMYLNK
ncbi:phosphatidylinositol N-acetylglucosaminyltransferase subunit P isoform X1 [Ostrinia furnacalis]|uniref:phosphatidylinositol N-acetylglucosaminyltransferase subunit P isoform X1 n=1 Tax=Ostrinia furnacalis TaxID=93504 RepID=UPI00103C11CD|nr:phosphatidylinositol N-acetylglucosaminyltransferase subunit P isoform X1 [Ostrinia furnacalis]XP_028157372.1 phosphatidylinositol N-acetylglucosaminyltransferase subunit P isoform X1 [Ostrinia furnacalis]